jgi:oxaloacetate decarboxylase alpha subunit
MFPKVAPNFFKTRADGPVVFKPEDAAPAAAKAPGQAESYNVNVNGVNYAVVVSPAGTVAAVPAAAPAPAGGGAVAAPAPAAGGAGGVVIPAPVAGTILRYVAAEGAQVASAATILILESMKMELEIKATASGKVHFLLPTGTQVAAQQPIVEIGGVAGAAAPAAPVPQAAPVSPAPAAVSAPSGGGTVVPAPVAGTVLRYAAAEGAQVASAATILILESMKMELEIKATVAGKVHFLVPTGTQVASQQPIAEIS